MSFAAAIESLFPRLGTQDALAGISSLGVLGASAWGMTNYYAEADKLYHLFDVDTVAHKIDEIGK